MNEFREIEIALQTITGMLNSQLSQVHAFYDVEWNGKKLYSVSNNSSQETKSMVIKNIVGEALEVALDKVLAGHFLADQYKPNPWERVIALMALRVEPEDVQSPISAQEYQEIKEIAVDAERTKAVNLESVYVNMHRPEWTETEQLELILRKEKNGN